MKQTKVSAFSKVYIFDSAIDSERGGFGKGIAELLRGVADTGSLNKAAKTLSMSYTKAWKRMNAVEEELGFTLITRDGAHGSALTPEGAELLRVYDSVTKRVSEYTKQVIQEEVAASSLSI
ncbi:MAG: LysR family transcriptional regulator [Eggerthellaceae bacterium]|nr:LysR family transcriptional regulator [Eggerthellaceae bacterium]